MLEAPAGSEADIAGRQRIAVLVPCYREEVSIAKVVGNFRAALPNATVYVYDNNSSDRTAEVAASAGAVVRREPRQGKGRVVRRMFTDVDADIYVLVDGDATYDAPSATATIERLLRDRLDMVVAVRVDREEAAYRPGHRLGNRLLTGLSMAQIRPRSQINQGFLRGHHQSFKPAGVRQGYGAPARRERAGERG